MRLALLALVLTAGCFQQPDPGGPPSGQCTNDGEFRITWTIKGQPASTECAAESIDHVDVTFTPDGPCDGGTISPTVCADGQMLYWYLPRGSAEIRVDAISRSGAIIGTGSVPYDIEPNTTTVGAIDVR